jgi:serine/threonine protein kinase
MSHSSLDAVIAGYLLAVEAGEVPNRQELLDHHPEHADALRAFFADLDRMDRVASPLRLAGGLDATRAVDANGHTKGPTVRYFGDYELLEEIARGGMGIVYKARQVSLNRLVALKMILTGSFASSRDVQRFRSEAEAAANLDHPHIVPIYEVGEHEGQQYYSMKFVEGTSLAKHPRSDPRREVEGMVAVIRAVHHAHQRGVLHRDLKPSNVLVDSQGTRLVTDFGLAKRLAAGDGSFTETGQVLGTPKYMAPEQAAGRKDLTVAADVYSLGVILYERLTGQTPFTGDNALTLLRQARESEPPRPSSIRAGLDRDLETVVLKCLEKEPSRRYPSAEVLAEDLDNWLAGRPITARPVGQAERFWRWCRRNPIVSSLTAAVAASLLIGIAVSTFFAVQASHRALAESRERARAIGAEKSMEGLLARSLAKPLDSDGESKATLSVPESEALWELTRPGDTDVSLRFLDEATRDPITTRSFVPGPSRH